MPTAIVKMGNVTAGVTSSGTLVPAQQVSLGFHSLGQLAELDVKVGDLVTAGQTLARLDARAHQIALQQAQAGLQQAQATLANAENGTAIVQAQDALGGAQTASTDAVNAANTTNQQDASQVAADQQQVQQDQQSAPSAAQLAALQQAVSDDTTALGLAVQQYQVIDNCAKVPNGPNCADDGARVLADQKKLSQDQTALATGDAAATRLATDQARLSADQARQQEDQATGQGRVDQARQAVVAAQDQLTAAQQNQPNAIQSGQAAVAVAQAQVASSQLTLDQDTLTAPIAGTVTSISGGVGETIPAQTAITPKAPGSNAPLPPAPNPSGSAAQVPSFMTLTNESGFQAVAQFAEADAARLQPGQTASLTFPAVPSLTVSAQVLAVSAVSTITQNVTNYLTTLVLDHGDPRLKAGMSTNATVTVGSESGVLTLPSLAVRHSLGQYSVVLLHDNGQRTTQAVQVGLVGDTSIEIVSGLNSGDRVVVPPPPGTGAAG